MTPTDYREALPETPLSVLGLVLPEGIATPIGLVLPEGIGSLCPWSRPTRRDSDPLVLPEGIATPLVSSHSLNKDQSRSLRGNRSRDLFEYIRHGG